MSQANEYCGTIHGSRIELDQSPALPEGQPVSIVLTPLEATVDEATRVDQLRESFGGWAEDSEDLVKHFEALRELRKLDRPGVEL